MDTTILVYAYGIDHPLAEPCRAVVELLRDGEVNATTTPEVLQEFTHVRARRRSRTDAVAAARDLAVLLAPLTVTTAGDLEEGLELFTRHDGLGSFDAVLAAVAVRLDARLLLSADRGLDQLDAVAVASPSSPGFLRQVGGAA